MFSTFDAMYVARGATLGINVETNTLSLSISNVMAHTSQLLFIKFLPTDLCCESAENVMAMVVDIVEQIKCTVGIKCQSFVSDFCNLTQSMHAKLLVQNAVKWAYGCVAHALNNLCENIAKTKFGAALNQGMLVSITMRFQNLLRRMLVTIRNEKIGNGTPRCFAPKCSGPVFS